VQRCVSLFCAGRVTRAKSFSSISCASINRPLLFCRIVNMLLPKGVTVHLCESLLFALRVTSVKSCPEFCYVFQAHVHCGTSKRRCSLLERYLPFNEQHCIPTGSYPTFTKPNELQDQRPRRRAHSCEPNELTSLNLRIGAGLGSRFVQSG